MCLCLGRLLVRMSDFVSDLGSGRAPGGVGVAPRPARSLFHIPPADFARNRCFG